MKGKGGGIVHSASACSFFSFFQKGVFGEILILCLSNLLPCCILLLLLWFSTSGSAARCWFFSIAIFESFLRFFRHRGLGTFGVDVVVVLLVVSDAGVPVGGGGVGAVAVGGLGGEVVGAGALWKERIESKSIKTQVAPPFCMKEIFF